MTRRIALLTCIALVVSVRAAVPHDGHGETVVMSGTIQALDSGRVEIETRDDTSLQLKRVWIVTNAKTQYKRGKARVDAEAAQMAVGERVTAVAKSEHAEGDSIRWVAVQIELAGKKSSTYEAVRGGKQ